MSKNKPSLKLARPTYLQDKRDIRAMDNYITSEGRGGGFTLFDTDNKLMKVRNHELYKPVKDQARIYEMHQIEKRYKMNFEQKKKGYYSSQYLISMSVLLNHNSKNYIKKRQELIDKFQPLYSDEFKKKFNNKFNTLNSEHKSRNINIYLTTTHCNSLFDKSNKIKKSCHTMPKIKLLNLRKSSSERNTYSDDIEIKEPEEKKKIGSPYEIKKFENSLRKKYPFYLEKTKLKRKHLNYYNNIYNESHVNYEKCINPSKKKCFNVLELKETRRSLNEE